MFNTMMPMAMPGVSLADIAAVTGNRNNGWGDGGGWWAWILFAMLFGWGGNGMWGNWGNGNNCCGQQQIEASIQRGFDNSAVTNKLNGLENGICSLGYDQLAQMNGINNNIFQTTAGVKDVLNSNQNAVMQMFNALSRQQDNCCCENRQAIAQVRYDMASNTCDIKTLVNQVAQQLMWGQQNGFRDISDLINNQFCALRMEQKDAIIANLQAQLNDCGRDSALLNLYNMLVGTLQPRSVPAYPAQNPNGWGNWAPGVVNQVGGNCCPQWQNQCCPN